MATSDLPRSDSTFSTGVTCAVGSRSGPDAGFRSVLTERAGTDGRLPCRQPDFFVDLHLDQVFEAITAGREHYRLEDFFYAPLHDPGSVLYRHEVLRDLEQPEVLASIRRFAERMGRMRGHLEQIEKLHYQFQKQSWFLDAVEIYSEAVRGLANDLAEPELTSRGLRGIREYLVVYTTSDEFVSLVAEMRALKEALAGIRYRVRIQGPRVTVSRYQGERDYSVEILEAFARFQQGAVRSYLVALPDGPNMNDVEARILDGVAELHSEVFAARSDYCARHGEYLDPTVAAFDREVQFYVAYLELVQRLRKAGLSFTYPHVSARSKEVAVTETFDVALATKLVGEQRRVVCNDFYLKDPERMFVVSGPNNGGKTTFARMFGQLHYLASLGLPVPGTDARLFLPDRIYTHFEREEDIATLRGKFDDELVRVHQILEQATASSIIVMNESFNTTTLRDAQFVGIEVMQRILRLGALGVYVTFVDEIASLSEATVSMVTQIVPENPAERTFKVLRKPADGLAYASAIAEKYGLTYERLTDRIGT